MRNGMWKKGLVLGIILLFVGTNIIAATNKETLMSNPLYISDRDQLDQSQTQCYGAGYGHMSYAEMAQSFKPTLSILTRIEIILWHAPIYNPTGTVKVSIRNSLTGSDLTSLTIDATNIPVFTYPNITWVEFDFPDITVVTEQTYYIYLIINLSTPDIIWGDSNPILNPYPRGQAYYNQNPLPDDDFCFKTFGLGNHPPNPPNINGPTNGKAGTAYPYSFTSTDPDGDEISYFIEWGDGDTTTWTEFRPSGSPGYSESHSWSTKGTYSIQAKAKDVHGNESDWETLTITMPTSFNIPLHWFWEKLLGRFPHAFPILRHLLGY